MANKKLHVKSEDTVLVLSGKDKGKTGKITVAMPKEGRVVVEGVNMMTKHQKPRGTGTPGAIVHKEAPINASNVLPICNKCNKATRVGHQILENGKKVRVCKKCGAQFDD